MVPTLARILGAVHGWSAGRPSSGRSRESLFHHSSTMGLDEERWSMVLELYCRKAERKREGGETEASHVHMERGGRKARDKNER